MDGEGRIESERWILKKGPLKAEPQKTSARSPGPAEERAVGIRLSDTQPSLTAIRAIGRTGQGGLLQELL